jgi:hypothetical protein
MAEEHEREFMLFGLDDQGDIPLFASNYKRRAEDMLQQFREGLGLVEANWTSGAMHQ